MSKELDKVNEDEKTLSTQNDAPMGFEDEEEGDLIVPRIKVVQALSPEFKDRVADEGDIINSLTKDKLNGKVFIPVFKFNNNIWWKPRADGGGMQCIARDGKSGIMTDGTELLCKMCKKNEFDNSKQGREAFPVCTKYINFFGFFEGEPMPIILSFAKTNYNEGKKMYSLAKITMQNMWNHGYILNSKKMSKAGNEWFNIDVSPAGATSEDSRTYGRQLFEVYRSKDLNFDMEDPTAGGEATPGAASEEELNSAEF